jgi:hypothetical protein
MWWEERDENGSSLLHDLFWNLTHQQQPTQQQHQQHQQHQQQQQQQQYMQMLLMQNGMAPFFNMHAAAAANYPYFGAGGGMGGGGVPAATPGIVPGAGGISAAAAAAAVSIGCAPGVGGLEGLQQAGDSSAGSMVVGVAGGLEAGIMGGMAAAPFGGVVPVYGGVAGSVAAMLGPQQQLMQSNLMQSFGVGGNGLVGGGFAGAGPVGVAAAGGFVGASPAGGFAMSGRGIIQATYGAPAQQALAAQQAASAAAAATVAAAATAVAVPGMGQYGFAAGGMGKGQQFASGAFCFVGQQGQQGQQVQQSMHSGPMDGGHRGGMQGGQHSIQQGWGQQHLQQGGGRRQQNQQHHQHQQHKQHQHHLQQQQQQQHSFQLMPPAHISAAAATAAAAAAAAATSKSNVRAGAGSAASGGGGGGGTAAAAAAAASTSSQCIIMPPPSTMQQQQQQQLQLQHLLNMHLYRLDAYLDELSMYSNPTQHLVTSSALAKAKKDLNTAKSQCSLIPGHLSARLFVLEQELDAAIAMRSLFCPCPMDNRVVCPQVDLAPSDGHSTRSSGGGGPDNLAHLSMYIECISWARVKAEAAAKHAQLVASSISREFDTIAAVDGSSALGLADAEDLDVVVPKTSPASEVALARLRKCIMPFLSAERPAPGPFELHSAGARTVSALRLPLPHGQSFPFMDVSFIPLLVMPSKASNNGVFNACCSGSAMLMYPGLFELLSVLRSLRTQRQLFVSSVALSAMVLCFFSTGSSQSPLASPLARYRLCGDGIMALHFPVPSPVIDAACLASLLHEFSGYLRALTATEAAMDVSAGSCLMIRTARLAERHKSSPVYPSDSLNIQGAPYPNGTISVVAFAHVAGELIAGLDELLGPGGERVVFHEVLRLHALWKR